MQDRRSFFGHSYLPLKRKWLRIDSIDLCGAINTALTVWPCGRVAVWPCGRGRVAVGVGFGVSVGVRVSVGVCGRVVYRGQKKPPIRGAWYSVSGYCVAAII